jgi:hypothetical protein
MGGRTVRVLAADRSTSIACTPSPPSDPTVVAGHRPGAPASRVDSAERKRRDPAGQSAGWQRATAAAGPRLLGVRRLEHAEALVEAEGGLLLAGRQVHLHCLRAPTPPSGPAREMKSDT